MRVVWLWVFACAWGAGLLAPLHAETVTVGAEDDWAPYSYAMAGQAEPQGLSPRLVRAAFQTQGVQVNFKVLPFSRCLHDAEIGRLVGCFDTTRTQANSHSFHWHTTPLFREELGIFARSGVPGREASLPDLVGHSVGITVGYTYPTEFMRHPGIRRHVAVSDANLLRMLAGGRVDYILVNTRPAQHQLHRMPELQGKVQRVGALHMDSFWLSFSKVHPDGQRLSVVFEKGLQTLMANGQYQRMLADIQQAPRP
ncbi:amino acid ABC transporter substrate-binding protein (PAAT family) [Aquabacterium commune]|uniref:Amino acid ABC transporter substrate-binding protein (PAAT family) n=1 Tax=Aquabacterium commune TaxID=70586 RepID=A0A4R6RHQ9_9BURK|nr:transporter substrate-binding domain-containing protein [Aquabacterium commune]TDP85933.1 amino acid ABC transporter substrate-binding protein (PAAT family) [Aquabacterium commune]